MGIGTLAVLSPLPPMLTNTVRSLLVLLALSGAALTARAQVTFTATAVASGTAGGYTNGQSYTFVYTLGGSFANNAQSTFTGTQKSWYEDTTAADQLFTTVTGSGLLGTFTRPVATFDPFSQLFVGTTNPLFKLQAAVDNGFTGLTTLDATPITLALVNVTAGMNVFTGVGYVEPSTYFSTNGYSGFYPGLTGVVLLQGAGFATIESFNITSVSISAIPEPATYAPLLGLAALGSVSRRRRLQRS
jgi:hypothetical protein